MATSADIRSAFRSTEAVLKARLDGIRSAFHHGTMKGAAVEELFRDFLSDVLPDNIGVGSGIVIDSRLRASKQIDIVLYDRAKTPIFFRAGGAQLFPIECVYFAMEVKTALSPEQFAGCVANMDSIKSLERAAYYESGGPIETSKRMFGKEYPVWQTIYIVLALETTTIEGVAERFIEHRRSARPIDRQIDTLYTLDNGVISNMNGGAHPAADLLPASQTRLFLHEEKSLSLFLALLSVYTNQVELGKPFNAVAYLGSNTGKLTMFPADPICIGGKEGQV